MRRAGYDSTRCSRFVRRRRLCEGVDYWPWAAAQEASTGSPCDIFVICKMHTSSPGVAQHLLFCEDGAFQRLRGEPCAMPFAPCDAELVREFEKTAKAMKAETWRLHSAARSSDLSENRCNNRSPGPRCSSRALRRVRRWPWRCSTRTWRAL
eukprot:11340003-Alexandrium_andersonii.AAC.1